MDSIILLYIFTFGALLFVGLALAIGFLFNNVCCCCICCCGRCCNGNRDEEIGGGILPISMNKDGLKMTESQAKEQCSICLDAFNKAGKRKMAVLRNCNHTFHYRCIVAWTRESRSCPLCRSAIRQVDESN